MGSFFEETCLHCIYNCIFKKYQREDTTIRLYIVVTTICYSTTVWFKKKINQNILYLYFLTDRHNLAQLIIKENNANLNVF